MADQSAITKTQGASGDSQDSITQLTNSIMQSAAGKPFDFSISAEMRQKEIARQTIRLMLLNDLLPQNKEDSAEKSDTKKKKKKTTGAKK